MSIAQVQRYLDTAVKAASVAITVPATWAVAGVAFGLMDVVLVRRVLQLAAVVAVDGVWLLSWYALDLRKRDQPEEKAYNALVVAAMYVATLVIALEHGEGAAVGWLWRARRSASAASRADIAGDAGVSAAGSALAAGARPGVGGGQSRPRCAGVILHPGSWG